MVGDHKAEKLLSKIILKHNLTTEDELEEVFKSKFRWETNNYADELVEQCIIKSSVMEKILPLVKKKGLDLPTYDLSDQDGFRRDDPLLEDETAIQDINAGDDSEQESSISSSAESEFDTPAAPTSSPKTESPDSLGESGDLGFVDEGEVVKDDFQKPDSMNTIGHSPDPIDSLNADADDETRHKLNLIHHSICKPANEGEQVLELLEQAKDANASDLYLAPNQNAFIRKGGRITSLESGPFSAEDIEAMLFDLLNANQKQKLFHDLQLTCSFEQEDGSRSRCQISRDLLGWSASFRLISKDVPSFDELGLADEVKDLCEKESGLILIAGAKASGKSSTLAAMLNSINQGKASHVITLEDPIEFKHSSQEAHISQRSLGSGSIPCAEAIKAALAQNPDVLVIADLSDHDSIRGAIQASESGCLVIASVSSPSAKGAIEHCASVSQQRNLLANNLSAVVFQSLSNGQCHSEVLLNDENLKKSIAEGQID